MALRNEPVIELEITRSKKRMVLTYELEGKKRRKKG
jgi:hypothetical protein